MSILKVMRRRLAMALAMARSCLLMLAISVSPGSGAWGAGLNDLGSGGVVTVAEAIDPETLRLDDGRIVRLAGIDAPKLGNEYDPAYAAAAVQLLGRLARQGRVEILQAERKMDRHGRLLAHIRRVADEIGADDWFQSALLSRGLARVMILPGTVALAADLLRIEAEARAKRIGLWMDSRYQVRDPDDLDGQIGEFQLVEGVVVATARVGERSYLNFGEDYKTDFTITFDAKVQRMFDSAGTDPLAFKGHRLRVRGWLESFNGPMIEIGVPEQIEVLE